MAQDPFQSPPDPPKSYKYQKMTQQSLQKYFPSTIRPSILNTWSLVPECRRRRRTNSQIQKPFPPKATRDETLLQGKTSLSIIGLHTLQINENVWQFGVRAPILIIMLMDVRSVTGVRDYFLILVQNGGTHIFGQAIFRFWVNTFLEFGSTYVWALHSGGGDRLGPKQTPV